MKSSPRCCGQNGADIPRVLWLGLPLASVVVVLLVPLDPIFFHRLVLKEFGFLELETVLFCLIAIVFALMALRFRAVMVKPMPVFVVLGALAAIYFVGEETSWGQHYLGFETPQAVEKINTQKEFNLHNLGGWKKTLFSSLPRTAATVAGFLGGIVLPLALRRRLENEDAPLSFWYWLVPNYRLVPAAFLFVFGAMPEKIAVDVFGVKKRAETYVSMVFQGASSEFKEYCFGMVLMFYFISIFYRARRVAGAKALGAPACEAHSPGM